MTRPDPSAIAYRRAGPRCTATVRLVLTLRATVDSLAGDSDAELSDLVEERAAAWLLGMARRENDASLRIESAELDGSRPAEWSR